MFRGTSLSRSLTKRVLRACALPSGGTCFLWPVSLATVESSDSELCTLFGGVEQGLMTCQSILRCNTFEQISSVDCMLYVTH